MGSAAEWLEECVEYRGKFSFEFFIVFEKSYRRIRWLDISDLITKNKHLYFLLQLFSFIHFLKSY